MSVTVAREMGARSRALKPRHPDEVAAARRDLGPDETYQALADSFRVLADPTRSKLVYLLLRREMCVTDLAIVLGVSESAVSQHLRVLRGQRLVSSRRDGQHVFYHLIDAHIEQLVSVGLEHLGDSEPERTPTGGTGP